MSVPRVSIGWVHSRTAYLSRGFLKVQRGQFTMVCWGRSILEPERGHVRTAEHAVIDGELVGFAICGAFLVGDLANESGEFPKCSVCLELLDE